MPTRRLLATSAAVVAAAGSATAIAIAASGSAERPPAKALAVAIHDALRAPDVQGVTARIEFTNKLIDSGVTTGADPLLTGASGRLWIGTDRRFRLELQSDNGDAQIVSDGTTLTVYDGASNAAYRAQLPKGKQRERAHAHRVPTIADIQKGLDRVVKHLSVSSATPSNVGGEPAYTVRLEPKRNGGLVGGAELAWDAARGVPLRVAVYAVGNASPVLELKVTDISYGAVPASTFALSLPSDVKVTKVERRGHVRRAGRTGHGRRARPVSGAAAVAPRLPFALAAPDTLAGMARSGVRLLGVGDKPAALVTYGKGLGGLAVIESVADTKAQKRAPSSGDERSGLDLPTIDLEGAKALVVPTALGTAVTFTRAGVHYVVVGSVRQSVAEAAARGL